MRKFSLFISTQLFILLLLGGFLAVRAQSTDYTTRIPVGTIQMYAGPSYPDISTGWIPADGRYLNIVDFPELYAVLGCYYFCDTGVGVFTVPNLVGQVPVMAGDDGDYGFLTPRVVGEAFGADSHSLTILEMPAHNHTITDPGHSHTIVNRNGVPTNRHSGVAGANPSNAENTAGTTNSGTANTTTSSTTGITVNNTGSGDFFDIWQPSYALNFMIWGGIPASAPEDIVITVVVVFPTHTPTPTLTPTLTPTAGPSPTPTETPSPTGVPGYQTVVSVGDQEVLMTNEVKPVDLLVVGFMGLFLVLAIGAFVLYLRRRR